MGAAKTQRLRRPRAAAEAAPRRPPGGLGSGEAAMAARGAARARSLVDSCSNHGP